MVKRHISAAPYPTHVLSLTLRDFADRVATITQASPALVGPVVLTAASAAVQGVADVMLPYGWPSPVSLNAWVIAPTGARKTSVMKHVTQAFEAFEFGELDQDDDSGDHADAAERKPRKHHPFLLEDATEAGIVDVFRNGARSAFHALDEGAMLFKKLDTAACCKRWDGSAIRHDTRTEGRIQLKGCRASVCLLTQDIAFSRLLDKKRDLLVESGLLPRSLLSFPPELSGLPPTRVASKEEELALSTHAFHTRMKSLLCEYATALDKKQQNRLVIELDPHATASWQRFMGEIDRHSCEGGSLTDVRPFTARAGEQVVRIAAVLQHFEQPGSPIQKWAADAACELVRWHVREAKAVFGEISPCEQIEHDAQHLLSYMRLKALRTGRATFTHTELEKSGPADLRKADRLDTALHHLQLQQHAYQMYKGRREYVALNWQPPVVRPSFLLPRIGAF